MVVYPERELDELQGGHGFEKGLMFELRRQIREKESLIKAIGIAMFAAFMVGTFFGFTLSRDKED